MSPFDRSPIPELLLFLFVYWVTGSLGIALLTMVALCIVIFAPRLRIEKDELP